MWPWEHFALGYLVTSLLWRVWGRRIDGWVVACVGFGTQFPDIVDKTLALYVNLLPSSRSLAHSALTAAPLSVFVLTVAVHKRRLDWGVAFVLAYLSHLFGDALPRVLEGYYSGLSFLLWPVLPALPDNGMLVIWERFVELLESPETYLAAHSYRVAIVFLMVVLWVNDGFPGPADIGRFLWRSSRFHDGGRQ